MHFVPNQFGLYICDLVFNIGWCEIHRKKKITCLNLARSFLISSGSVWG